MFAVVWRRSYIPITYKFPCIWMISWQICLVSFFLHRLIHGTSKTERRTCVTPNKWCQEAGLLTFACLLGRQMNCRDAECGKFSFQIILRSYYPHSVLLKGPLNPALTAWSGRPLRRYSLTPDKQCSRFSFSNCSVHLLLLQKWTGRAGFSFLFLS